MAKKIDIKDTSIEDLIKLLGEKREVLRTARFSSLSRSIKDTTEPRKVRVEIARIMTELGNRSSRASA